MSRVYGRVYTSFWQSAQCEGWSQDAELLALYLLTCKHRSTEGLFRLPLGYALADLPKTWRPGRLKKALTELIESGFIAYDWDAEVVLIRKALSYQRPENPNQRIHALGKLNELPTTTLWFDFLQVAEMYDPAFHEVLLDHLQQGLLKPLGEGMAQPQALALTPSHNSDSISVTQPQYSISSSPSQAQDSSSELNNPAHDYGTHCASVVPGYYGEN